MALSGCLVLNLSPAYDDESIMWDAGLLGHWDDPEDRASCTIEAGEWKSYKVHYVYPIESGDLTGHLTAVGDDRYLDLMPASGLDRGSFVVPVHIVLKVESGPGRLELVPLSYDWFFDRLRGRRAIPGLAAVFDQKDNVLIVSPPVVFRAWLRARRATDPAFGAGAMFVKGKEE